MNELVAVMSHKAADRLGSEWKAGRCNAYTRTMVRVCASEAEAWRIGRSLSCVWALERPGQ